MQANIFTHAPNFHTVSLDIMQAFSRFKISQSRSLISCNQFNSDQDIKMSQPTLRREGEAKQNGVSTHEENAWSYNQRLFEENIRKTKKTMVCRF